MKKSITVKSKNARSEKVEKNPTVKQSDDFSEKSGRMCQNTSFLSMSVDILQLKYS